MDQSPHGVLDCQETAPRHFSLPMMTTLMSLVVSEVPMKPSLDPLRAPLV